MQKNNQKFMRKKLLLLAACAFYGYGQAQTLKFTYDASGNQVKREIVTIGITSLQSSTEASEENTMLPNVNSTNINSTTIEIYPNPVVDLLNVEWPLEIGITEVVLFDNNGRMLQLKKVSNNLDHLTFDLSSYASGMYYIRVFDASKQSRTFKIIKK